MLAATMLVAVSCAAAAEGRSPGVSDSGPDFRQPLPVTIEVLSQAGLAFTPRVAHGLGTATKLVARGRSVPAVFRSVAWVYDHPTYGTFYVKESIIDGRSARGSWAEEVSRSPGCQTLTPGDLEGFGSGASGTRCSYGGSSFVTIRGATQAFVEELEQATFLHWLEPARGLDPVALAPYRANVPEPMMEVLIAGPAPEFTAEDAAAVAELV
jgi:hypothetical protein